MRVLRLHRHDTDAEMVVPAAATEALAMAIDAVPNGILVDVLGEDMDEGEFHGLDCRTWR